MKKKQTRKKKKNRGGSCHRIIAPPLKLGEDEIAYINPAGVMQGRLRRSELLVLLLSRRLHPGEDRGVRACARSCKWSCFILFTHGGK